MRKIAVYVATTGGPVRVERIIGEDAPLSQVYLGRTYRPLEPLSGDYARFVGPSGPVARAFGPFETASFRLELSGPIGSGNSWELGLFIAHGLVWAGTLAGGAEGPDAVFVLTGQVDIDLKVGSVGHIADKVAAARDLFDHFRAQGIPISLILPKADAGFLPAEGLTGVEIRPVDGALEVLRTAMPEPLGFEGMMAIPNRRRGILRGILLVAVMSIFFILVGGWDRLRPLLLTPANVVSPPSPVVDEPRAVQEESDPLAAAIADDLLNGLIRNGYGDGARRRLVLWPFDDRNIPVAKPFADQLMTRLLSVLADRGRERYEIIAGDALLAEMERNGVLEDTGGAPIASLLKNGDHVDLLIEGQMSLDRGAVSVSYRAIRMDGAVASQVPPRPLVPATAASVTMTNLSRDQAVAAAVRILTERSADMTELRLNGIRFQDSGQQTPFGLYLQERMAAALDDAMYGAHAGRRLKVATAGIAADRIATLDGTTVTAGNLAREASGAGTGVYTLHGSYWDFSDGIEVRLTLQDEQGRAASWVGRLHPDSLGDLPFRPDTVFDALRRQDGRGPIAVHLSSDRGIDPAYRLGETLHLILRIDRAAWMSCFYRQADRRWIRLFPNAYHPDGLIPAGQVVTLPGKNYPFDLTFTGPVGAELVKCFATTRDVTADLPAEFRSLSSKPTESDSDARLLQAFRSLGGVGVSEASLAITVSH